MSRSPSSDAPTCGSGSEGTATICSPGNASPSRLVAKIATPGHLLPRTTMTAATPSRRCSQLSSTTSACFCATVSVTTSSSRRAGGGTIRNVAASASHTPFGSVTAASSQSHAPSGKSLAAVAATSNARRVLPTPPTPVSVISGDAVTSSARCFTSSSRPTKVVTCRGRLPPTDAPVRSGANSRSSPGAHTWNTRSARARSRRVCSPRSTRVTPSLNDSRAISAVACEQTI